MRQHNTGDMHPHFPKASSKRPQKGPQPHGFHGVAHSETPLSEEKPKGKRILVGEQREELMPDPKRKIVKFPHEWPSAPAPKAKAKKAVAKKKPAKAKAAKAKKAVKVKAKKAVAKKKPAVKAKAKAKAKKAAPKAKKAVKVKAKKAAPKRKTRAA
jgi:hypothetical protein